MNACYLYCLTPSGCGLHTTLTGVDGNHPTFVHPCGDLDAVLSEVEVDEFCGESAETRMQDLTLLGPRVCRHETVIEEVMRRIPVLPVGFGSIFTSTHTLEQTVLEHREAIATFFTELGDSQEWAVKGLLRRAVGMADLESLEQAAVIDSAPAASAGARYLQDRRARIQSERNFNLRLKEFCRKAAAALGAHALRFRERKILDAAIAKADTEVVLNWAFLLAPAALEDFNACLHRFNGGESFPGLTLTPTGPWPAYSFAPHLSRGAKQ